MCSNVTSGRKLHLASPRLWKLAPSRRTPRVMDYTVYILACADGTLYTGIARDAGRRVDEHNGVAGKGARYTASRRPVRIVYQAAFASRSEALREEIRIKRLSRALKDELIAAAVACQAASS